MAVRRPQIDKKDSGKMGFSSLPLGGMGTADKSGNPTPSLGGPVNPTMRGFQTPRWLEFGPLFKPQPLLLSQTLLNLRRMEEGQGKLHSSPSKPRV